MVCMATTTSRAVFWTIAELEEIGVNAAAELVHQYLFGVDLVDCWTVVEGVRVRLEMRFRHFSRRQFFSKRRIIKDL